MRQQHKTQGLNETADLNAVIAEIGCDSFEHNLGLWPS